jgi:hypothetical protein
VQMRYSFTPEFTSPVEMSPFTLALGCRSSVGSVSVAAGYSIARLLVNP